MFKKYAFLMFVLVLVITQLACGIGGGECEGLNDVDCNTPGVQLAGEQPINNVIDEAFNGSNPQEVHPTPCPGIVC